MDRLFQLKASLDDKDKFYEEYKKLNLKHLNPEEKVKLLNYVNEHVMTQYTSHSDVSDVKRIGGYIAGLKGMGILSKDQLSMYKKEYKMIKKSSKTLDDIVNGSKKKSHGLLIGILSGLGGGAGGYYIVSHSSEITHFINSTYTALYSTVSQLLNNIMH